MTFKIVWIVLLGVAAAVTLTIMGGDLLSLFVGMMAGAVVDPFREHATMRELREILGDKQSLEIMRERQRLPEL